jgi:CrcB protein
MNNYLLVAVGAAFGGMFRYWMSGFVQKFTILNFPIGTLSVNILGSFALGIIIFYLDAKELISSEMRLLLTIGVCGGFTTFSTFSYETFELLRNSQIFWAVINIFLNLILTIFAILLAYYLSKIFGGV